MSKRRCLLSALTALLAITAVYRSVVAYPEPAVVPQGWQLTFTHAKPRAISLKLGDQPTQWYWYMTYKVINDTGQERLFIPDIEIGNDQGENVIANKGVPATIYKLIKEAVHNQFLESPNEVVGKILQGEDYAKESMIVWPAAAEDVDAVTVYVAGISGETQVIKNPKTSEPVVMRKSLMIRYEFPGTHVHPQQQSVIQRGEEWIMR